MNRIGISVSWDAVGITLALWLPLFIAIVWFLRRKKIVGWRFRLIVSLFAAAGLAPSAFPIHAELIVIPAVTAVLTLEHMDSSAFWFAGLFGFFPILITTATVFVTWSLFTATRTSIHPAQPTPGS